MDLETLFEIFKQPTRFNYKDDNIEICLDWCWSTAGGNLNHLLGVKKNIDGEFVTIFDFRLKKENSRVVAYVGCPDISFSRFGNLDEDEDFVLEKINSYLSGIDTENHYYL